MQSHEQPRVLTDAELDHVHGGSIRPIIDPTISNMLLNGVLDPWWEIVGKTGHLPTPA